MSKFTAFRDRAFEKPGFYVLRTELLSYGDKPYEQLVYAEAPKGHYGKTVSYFCTTPNDRHPETRCDAGVYRWANSYTTGRYDPTHWRPMTEAEELEFRPRLYRFGKPRPSIFTGRELVAGMEDW